MIEYSPTDGGRKIYPRVNRKNELYERILIE